MLLLPIRVGTPRGFWVAWQCPRQGKGADQMLASALSSPIVRPREPC